MKTKLRLVSVGITTLFASLSYAGNFYMGPSLFVVDNQASNSSFRGLYPSLSFGYTIDMLEDIYLGIEAFGVPSTMTLDDNYHSPYLSAKTAGSFGASVIPGASINNNTMGFFRFGVQTSKFLGPSVYGTGVQWGLGLQTVLTPNWDVRAEYIYTTYKTISNLGAVKTDQVGIGLIYKVL